MPRPIVMPSFGMYTVEGTLVKWLEATGAEVAEGVPILEIETDKATQEVVAPAGGRLHQVAAEGDHVVEQGVLGYILAEGEQPPEPPAGEPSDGTRPAGRGPRTAPKPTGDPSTAPSPATPAARR